MGPKLGRPEDSGVAGASAQREYEARRTARRERVRRRLGNVLGDVVLAVTNEPQSTRAWAQGAAGEAKLAAALVGVPNLMVLHDRRVPKTKGNIDHLLIAPAGIFVVDAKNYRGRIEVRNLGFFKANKRLFVGRRDCSKLAENMRWQVDAVLGALAAQPGTPPPVTPVLCFVDGDWPLLWPPTEFEGVRLEGTRSIKKLVSSTPVLDAGAIGRIHHVLATAFPPK